MAAKTPLIIEPDFFARGREWRHRASEFLSGYFWFIFKNVIGWILIIGSPVLGVTLPGPGGTVGFLIGFALVTFPGKRKLTSRVMRGRGLPIEMEVFTFLTALFAILTTIVLMWFVVDKVYDVLQTINLDPRRQNATYAASIAGLLVTGLLALGATWLVMRLSLKVLNYILKGIPFLRRKMRPWMRRKGLNLLPSRRKLGTTMAPGEADKNEEILEIDQRHQRRLRMIGQALLLWAKRAIGVAITVAIFYYIFHPVHRQWPLVRTQVLKMSPISFLTAAGMFAIFLLTFRVLVWRKILVGFGHNLPIAPATRIWSTSELARYLPIPILQVVGRIYLLRPYGVSGAICSVSQLLELAIFLLANLIVAVVCLGIYGFKHLEGHAFWWLVAAAILLPLLLTLLHTRVFYGITNGILSRLGRPRIVQRVRGAALPGFLAWNVFGLLWQSLALFVLMQQPLSLKIDWLWTLSGAYCLAWCAGFLAFWAPAGLGVRELVFIAALKLIAPLDMQSTEGFGALVAFLSVVSRLWTVAGEMILVTLAYALDLRGAFGRPDAPGRIVSPAAESEVRV